MNRRRNVRILAVVAMVALASVWGSPAEAKDVTGTVQRVGWWTSRLGAQPTVDPGKLEVAFGTDLKPNSVAAVDVALPVGPVQALSLSLTELAGTANQIGHIRVCLAAPGWKTANAGKLAEAPTMDCTAAADLTRSLDGNWLGDLAGLVPNGGTASLGLILVNDLDVPASIGASVQISTIALTGQISDDEVVVIPTTQPPSDSTPTTAFGDSSVEPSSGYVAPDGGSFDAPPLETPAGETPAAPTAPTTTIAEAPPPLLPASFESEGKPWGRLLIVLPLAIGIGFATVYGRRALDARGPA